MSCNSFVRVPSSLPLVPKRCFDAQRNQNDPVVRLTVCYAFPARICDTKVVQIRVMCKVKSICFSSFEIFKNESIQMKRTLIIILFCKSVVTSTLVVSVSVGTLGSILTRIGRTVVYILKQRSHADVYTGNEPGEEFFIFIQFLLHIDQYYCRRSVLESSRYFYKCSFRRYLGYTKMVIDLWGLSKRSRFLKGSPFLGRLSCMLFARYIVTADLSISHKEVFFCFVLSKELECRLTRDLIVSGDLTTSKVIPVSRTVTLRLNLNSFWFSGFQVYSISKGMRVFHEGFQTPRKK